MKALKIYALTTTIALFWMASQVSGDGHAAGEKKESVAERIARAMSAAPKSISEKATIQDGKGHVLREGSNAWTCMPDVLPGQPYPMCNDKVWNDLMRAVGEKAPFQAERMSISYMLQGDAPVSNTDPYATDPENGHVWIQEGPHLMVVLPDPASLEGISTDPHNGGPYVMWKGTPYAHIMVPLGEELR